MRKQRHREPPPAVCNQTNSKELTMNKSQLAATFVLVHSDEIKQRTKAGRSSRNSDQPFPAEQTAKMHVARSAAVGVAIAAQAVALLNAGEADLLRAA